MEALKKGTIPDNIKSANAADRSNYGSRRAVTKDSAAKMLFQSPDRQSTMQKSDFKQQQLSQVESAYRNDNLQQNMH